jgi:hypothetical protein
MNRNESTAESPVKFYRIPEEVIKAWERGDYFTGGVPSLAYERLGVALRLRGLYTYERETGQDYRGIAKIDLAGGLDLVMAGIRFWIGEQLDVKFWKTQFSHFLDENNKIIWTYQLFDCVSDEQLWASAGIERPDIKGPNSATLGFRPEDWQRLQQFLLKDEFDKELGAAKTRCTSPDQILTIMLHFEIQTDGEIVALYRELRQGKEDIAGDSRFKPIKS